MIGIYKITSPSGRVYVGQAVDIEKRFKQYLNLRNCKGQIHLYNSFIKHGITSHIFEIIEECSVEFLNQRERFWQDHYDVLNGGLNLVLQSTEEKPKIYSNDIRSKMSLAKTGVPKSDKTRKNMSIAKSGEGNNMYGRTGELSPTSKKVIDSETGTIYNSAKEAAESLNMKHRTLTGYLSGTRKNKTTLKYYNN